ncbi:expressed unknown protein [Seminavis robusta]|uniref:Uncharacterized protein n=1 Tax=Seminavis robusta TaxID=568900 RepID=A0A9N8EPU8_9STRA|nr:expressed unknown protein [Seminavis robusta]|eukprot:Sro1555_g282110.1 n/a (350) ;mRNA; r:5350-6399
MWSRRRGKGEEAPPLEPEMESAVEPPSSASGHSQLFLGLVVFLVGVVAASLFSRDSSISLTTGTTTSKTVSTRTKKRGKLGDGCFHIFLDVGGDLGLHARFVLEPQWYSDAVETHKVIDGAFGPPSKRDNRDICVFAFPNAMAPEDQAVDEDMVELHQKRRNRRQQLQAAYAKLGWKFLSIEPDTNTITAATNTTKKTNKKHSDAPGVQVAKWMQTHLLNRQLPTTIHGDYHGTGDTGNIVVKFDVPHLELLVAPGTALREATCLTMDRFYGEWKTSREAVAKGHNPVTGLGALASKYDTPVDAQTAFGTLWNLKQQQLSSCKSQWLGMFKEEQQLVEEDVPLPMMVGG